MKKQWATGFTIIELLIIILVLGIIVTLCVVGYNGIRQSTMQRVAQSDLKMISAEMERSKQKSGIYPTSFPAQIKTSSGLEVTLVESGNDPLYTNVSTVQNGVLFAQICADLVTDGEGRGPNQAGVMQNYITGCGNWNHDSMQFTGWNSKLWNTPVTSEQLLTYANNFTTSDTWNKSQEEVTETFYNKLVERFIRQGGTFPVTSFWDSWATPQNGGVIQEPLESNPILRPYYCVEAQVIQYPSIVWHITQADKLVEGSC